MEEGGRRGVGGRQTKEREERRRERKRETPSTSCEEEFDVHCTKPLVISQQQRLVQCRRALPAYRRIHGHTLSCIQLRGHIGAYRGIQVVLYAPAVQQAIVWQAFCVVETTASPPSLALQGAVRALHLL